MPSACDDDDLHPDHRRRAPGPVRVAGRRRRGLPPDRPLAPGHTLVVPIEPSTTGSTSTPTSTPTLWTVAKTIGGALEEASTSPTKVGVLVVGEEVPHAHVHLVPFTELSQMSFANQDTDPDPAALDAPGRALRADAARRRATARTCPTAERRHASGSGSASSVSSGPSLRTLFTSVETGSQRDERRRRPAPGASRAARGPRCRGRARCPTPTAAGSPASGRGSWPSPRWAWW